MAKSEVKKVDLKAVAMQEMETLIEQHNELAKSIQEQQGRLTEVKSMLLEKQGYMKGLEDCDANCEKDA
tara:strand:+ start:32 stop:238 length:207 start_codon:yes stop_codon:yes gene_type:complete